MANTWNQSGTTWDTGRWGTTDAITSGWGADSWNTGGSWGQANDEIVFLTGLSATFSVGELSAFAQQGWGRDLWGEEPWGESFDPVVKPSGVSATFSVGTVTVSAQIAVGWGQDGWGVENYGESGLVVEVTGPDAIQSNVGASGWNGATWGQGQGWGMFTLNPADVMGLTGVSSTANVGSITPIIDFTGTLTGVSATSNVGSLTVADMAVGLSGQAATPAVGALSPADVMGLTGVSATGSVGSLLIEPIELINVTGVSSTSSVGSLTVADMAIGLTGVSATFNVGTLSPADVMGLTGVSTTASVAAFGTASGFGIQAYQDVDTGSNTTYTDAA
tara:strand:+ start:420 stop:1418 length:999 start_codon:yes stop_codon:yes gene_type:complete